MNAIPPSLTAGQDAADPAAARWAALCDAAAIVAVLADADPIADANDAADFAARVTGAEAWRRVMVENGIADLGAIMEPGIAALMTVNARGADPRPAAQALWREFSAAREAIVALLPPKDVAAAPTR